MIKVVLTARGITVITKKEIPKPVAESFLRYFLLEHFNKETFPLSQKQAQPKPIAVTLPGWCPQLCEEYRAHLIDCRIKWFGSQPPTWRDHLQVDLLSVGFLWEVTWSHVCYWLQRWFQPMLKRRL